MLRYWRDRLVFAQQGGSSSTSENDRASDHVADEIRLRSPVSADLGRLGSQAHDRHCLIITADQTKKGEVALAFRCFRLAAAEGRGYLLPTHN